MSLSPFRQKDLLQFPLAREGLFTAAAADWPLAAPATAANWKSSPAPFPAYTCGFPTRDANLEKAHREKPSPTTPIRRCWHLPRPPGEGHGVRGSRVRACVACVAGLVRLGSFNPEPTATGLAAIALRRRWLRVKRFDRKQIHAQHRPHGRRQIQAPQGNETFAKQPHPRTQSRKNSGT